MKKNVAGQVVLAQLVSKTDGSNVTSGATTVSVTGDAGTTVTGSVGAGAATHEGGGLWSYAPAQAETNFDNVCFQFANASAVTANIQIYPTTVDADAIADAVWDEQIADHQDAGSTGEALNDAGSTGNPWNAIIEGSYTAKDLMRVMAAVAAGKTNILKLSNGATVTFRDITDASDIVEAQMQKSNRIAVTITL